MTFSGKWRDLKSTVKLYGSKKKRGLPHNLPTKIPKRVLLCSHGNGEKAAAQSTNIEPRVML